MNIEEPEEPTGPSLDLVDGTPAFVFPDGTVRKTTAPHLFDTGSGKYIAYADGWETVLDELFPDGYESEAEQVAEEYDLVVSEPPSIWLLVALTLETV